jgi:hypothetical protein
MKNRVGDLVAVRIPEWIVADRKGCSCKSKRQKMNRDGPDKVEAELEDWVEYFLLQKKHLRKAFQTIPDAALRFWLALVIRRACKLARDRLQN